MRNQSGFIVLLITILVTLATALSPQTQPPAEISGLRYYQHADFFRLVLELTRVREYSAAELNQPERLYLDIYQARLNPSLQGKTFEFNYPCVRVLRLAQRNQTTVRVTLELETGTKEKEKVYYLKNPDRLVVDIYHRQSETTTGRPTGPAEPQPSAPGRQTVETAVEHPPQAARPTGSGYSLVRQLGLGVKKNCP